MVQSKASMLKNILNVYMDIETQKKEPQSNDILAEVSTLM